MDTSPTPRAAGLRRPAPPRARATAGFTIVEVAMATFVMLFALASSILAMQSGFRALDTARKTTLAAQIMQSEMERIRMLNWTQIKAMVGDVPQKIDFKTIFPQNTATEREMYRQIDEAFTAMRTTKSLAAYDNEVCEIEVLITWRGIDGTLHQRSSSTQYCANGLYSYYYRTP
jgi:hypothetical protein